MIKIFVISFVFSVLFIIAGCGSDNEDEQKKLRITNADILEKFNTKNNPGKWKNLKTNHLPVIEIEKSKNEIEISVKAPFESKPDHYTEFILLLDSGFKEIEKKSFKYLDKNPEVVFTLSAKQKGEYYIVLKCNLHEMWMEHIIIK